MAKVKAIGYKVKLKEPLEDTNVENYYFLEESKCELVFIDNDMLYLHFKRGPMSVRRALKYSCVTKDFLIMEKIKE